MDKNNEKIKGIIFILISGASFGVMPILAKLAYSEGANAYNTLALRFAFSALSLYFYIRYKKISLKLNSGQVKLILFLGVIGYSFTSIFLFLAYNYVSSAVATAVLYTYPIMVMLLSIIIYKEKFKLKKLMYVFFTIFGIWIMSNTKGQGSSSLGIIFVLIAGFSYAIYVIGTASPKLKTIDSFVMSFYISLIVAVADGVVSIFTNSFSNSISFIGIMYIILLALISTVISLMTFLKGVRIIGPTNAALFSTVEPIVSLILGAIILGEKINIFTISGVGIIIITMILLARDSV